MMKTKKSRKKVVLVLSGGNAHGLAHVGALTLLDRFKVPINAVIGCSMGALVGGIYCAGKLKEFRKQCLTEGKTEIFRRFIAKPSVLGIVQHGKIEHFLSQFIGNKKIENLNKKYACVSLDLVSGKVIIINKGKLSTAIMASTSLPGIFVPIKKGSQIMVDPGYFDPLPIGVAKKLFPSYSVLAVDVRQRKEDLIKPGKIPNIINTFYRMIQIGGKIWVKTRMKKPDILIKPKVSIGRFQYHLAEKAIMAGEEAVLFTMPEIKKKLGLKPKLL